jgi:PIN domain nuclease of toxin-antitoxin system
VIVLDTHICVWWVHGDPALSADHSRLITGNETTGIGISAISCWEVAKLVQLGRLTLPISIDDWFRNALAYPGVQLLELTPQIAVESTQLPGAFHKDPADQLIVATARVHGCELLTQDRRIRSYQHALTP